MTSGEEGHGVRRTPGLWVPSLGSLGMSDLLGMNKRVLVMVDQ